MCNEFVLSLLCIGRDHQTLPSPLPLQVACIQVNILNEVEHLPQTHERDEALKQLNAQLMDITTLYGQFADEFDLHECKLSILHCAGHYDSGLVESVWRSIISEGEWVGGRGVWRGMD